MGYLFNPIHASAHIKAIPADGSSGAPITMNGVPITSYVGIGSDPDTDPEMCIVGFIRNIQEGYGSYSFAENMAYHPYTQEQFQYVLNLMGLTEAEFWELEAIGMARAGETSNYPAANSNAVCDHDYESELISNPTCSEPGSQTYTCTKCGDTYDEEIPATGQHEYTETITIEPACNHTGVLTYTCDICGAKNSKILPRIDHQYTCETTKNATCETDGVNTYTCNLCGDTYTEAIIHAGHQENSAGEITVEPTVFSSGMIEYRCMVCDIVLRTESIQPRYKQFFGNLFG